MRAIDLPAGAPGPLVRGPVSIMVPCEVDGSRCWLPVPLALPAPYRRMSAGATGATGRSIRLALQRRCANHDTGASSHRQSSGRHAAVTTFESRPVVSRASSPEESASSRLSGPGCRRAPPAPALGAYRAPHATAHRLDRLRGRRAVPGDGDQAPLATRRRDAADPHRRRRALPETYAAHQSSAERHGPAGRPAGDVGGVRARSTTSEVDARPHPRPWSTGRARGCRAGCLGSSVADEPPTRTAASADALLARHLGAPSLVGVRAPLNSPSVGRPAPDSHAPHLAAEPPEPFVPTLRRSGGRPLATQ